MLDNYFKKIPGKYKGEMPGTETWVEGSLEKWIGEKDPGNEDRFDYNIVYCNNELKTEEHCLIDKKTLRKIE